MRLFGTIPIVKFKEFIRKNWILVLGAIYVLSPIDFIPEVFFPIGFADDILIMLGTLFVRYLKQKKETEGKIVDGEIIDE